MIQAGIAVKRWPPFREKIQRNPFAFSRKSIEILQVNVGKLCNQTCVHCHVDASPRRKEIMTPEMARAVLAFLKNSPIKILDITGGAPELNPNFRFLVQEARGYGVHVMDRCNLTVFFEPGLEDLPEFLKAHQMEIIASLPCYTKENVDQQRGRGVFDKSIKALQIVNRLGYAKAGSGLKLNLVYNPVGDFLPPPQEELERDYRRALMRDFGIEFNQLYTITNMPILRFERYLKATGRFESYMHLLEDSFNASTLDQVMCRNTLSVGWEGTLYDCDFNQMLELPLRDFQGKPITISDARYENLVGKEIIVDDHCYGCTAGSGSSCGGSLL